MRAMSNESESRSGERAPFHPASAEYQIACRLFPGFAALPRPVVVSLEAYAPLIAPGDGPLDAADRAAIAAAVVEIVAGGPVPGAPVVPADLGRGVALADFASRLLGGASGIDATDLERLLRSGFARDEVVAAAETAIGFHVVARLAHAAHAARRTLPLVASVSASAAARPVAAAACVA